MLFNKVHGRVEESSWYYGNYQFKSLMKLTKSVINFHNFFGCKTFKGMFCLPLSGVLRSCSFRLVLRLPVTIKFNYKKLRQCAFFFEKVAKVRRKITQILEGIQ